MPADEKWVVFLSSVFSAREERRKMQKDIKEKLLNNEEENVTMCVIAEKLENRGIQKGIEQGIEQGIERGQLLLIKKMIEDGRLEIAEGAKYLNISVEELSTKIFD